MSVAELLDASGFGPFQQRQMRGIAPAWAFLGAAALVHPVVFRTELLEKLPDGSMKPLDQASVWRDLGVDEEFAGFVASSWFFGFVIGVTITGKACDVYGRQICYRVTSICVFIASLALAFAPTAKLFLAARWCLALATSGMQLSSFCLVKEMLPRRRRALMIVFPNFAFALGVCGISLLSWLITAPPHTEASTITGLPPWRELLLMLSVMAAPCTLMLGTESPIWHDVQGEKAQALSIIEEIYAENGTPDDELRKLLAPAEAQSGLLGSQAVTAAQKFSHTKSWCVADSRPHRDNICDGRLRGRLTLMLFTWGAAAYAYYGLLLSAEELTGTDGDEKQAPEVPELSLDIKQLMQGLVEFPGFGLAYICSCYHTFGGRRFATFGALMMGSVGPAIYLVDKETGILVSQLCCATAFAAVFLYGLELFPVSVSATALGLQSLCGRLTPMTVPLVQWMTAGEPRLMMVALFAPCLIIGALGYRNLPETLGKQIAGTIREMEEMSWRRRSHTVG